MPGARRWRKLICFLHEWLGLVSLAGLLIVGATGAAIVFLGELFVLQYGDMLKVPAAQREQPIVSADRLVASAVKGYGAPLLPQGVLMPHSRIPVDVALVYGFPEDTVHNDPLMLVVNPYTGEYQGSFWLDEAIGHELVHLHADLLAGNSGRLVVVSLGAGTILFFFTGLYLWWPRSGSPGRKLMTTTFRRRSLTVFVLHSLLGIWLGPLLLFYSLTGIATAKPEWFSPLIISPFAHAPAAATAGEGGTSEQALPLSEAVAIAQAEFPDRRLAALNFGGDERLIGMTFKAPGDLNHFYGDAHAWVDRRDGRLLEIFVARERSAATAAGAVMHSLHAGLFFGIPGMIASILTGMGLALLCSLGVVLWWRRRKRGHPFSKAN